MSGSRVSSTAFGQVPDVFEPLSAGAEPRLLDLGWQRLSRAAGAFNDLPVITVTGAVVQRVAMADRCPLRRCGGADVSTASMQ